ncbi:MAG: hypothetical protein J5642_00285 [Bacteroidales bacterium]|nr:hypothetical protein [Bacteroidales bacterium]
MKKIALSLFLLAATGAFAQDLLVPESYGIYAYDGYNELILGKLLPTDKKSSPKEKTDAIGEGSYKTFYLCAPSFSGEYAFCVTKEEIVYKHAHESIWAALRKSNPSAVTVSTFTMKVTESESQQLKDLFEHATMTASFFSNRLGLDGTTYYFNSGGRLASVWSPDEGRTARLVTMADSICYAVRHQDRDVLMRQLKVCRELTAEFKREYPSSNFTPYKPYHPYELGKQGCVISNTRFYLLKQFEQPADDSIMADFFRSYSDSIAVWSREIFLTDENSVFYVEINTSKQPECTINHEHHSSYWLILSDELCRREIILSAFALQGTRYRLDENLHWQPVEE